MGHECSSYECEPSVVLSVRNTAGACCHQPSVDNVAKIINVQPAPVQSQDTDAERPSDACSMMSMNTSFTEEQLADMPNNRHMSNMAVVDDFQSYGTVKYHVDSPEKREDSPEALSEIISMTVTKDGRDLGASIVLENNGRSLILKDICKSGIIGKWQAQNPGKLGDQCIILEVNGQTDTDEMMRQLAQDTTLTMRLKNYKVQTFTMTLSKKDAGEQKLGIFVRPRLKDQCLYIEKIYDDGLVAKWAADNPGLLGPDCAIYEVNGLTEPTAMIKEISKADDLTMQIKSGIP